MPAHSCTVKKFPLPEREYRTVPSGRWDAGLKDREYYVSPRRTRRRRRFLPLLLGLALFCCGFWFGRAASAHEPLPPESKSASSASSLSADGGGRTDGVMPEAPTVNNPADPAWIALDPEPIGGSNISAEAWNLLLVNWESPLPEDYTPPELTQLANGHAIDSRAYPALQAMMDAARAAGLAPTICSSYRTWGKQQELFNNKVQRLLNQGYSRTEADAQAAMWVARPGTSEHQAGLAVDIVDKSYQLLDEHQEDTAVQKWLIAHCAEYGFILRYPTDKSALTGVNYEPWHYRYVGMEAAEEIMEQGLCLEEYLSQLSG